MKDADILLSIVAERLRDSVRLGRTVEAAQMRVVGLEALCQQAGAQWPHIRNRIRNKARIFLEKRLGQDDIVLPCGDGFLIVFAAGDVIECAQRSEALGQELEAFFLGDESLNEVHPRLEHFALSRETLADLVAAKQHSENSRAEEVAPEWTLCSGFLPLWSPITEMIIGYVHSPVRPDRALSRSGYGPTPLHPSFEYDKAVASADLLMLETAIDKVRHLRDTSACGVCVHMLSLASEARRRSYMDRLNLLPIAARRRFIVMLNGVGPETPRTALADCVAFLRNSAVRVAITYNDPVRPPTDLPALDLWGVGCSLPPHRPDVKGAGLAVLKEQMTRWRKLASSNTRLYLTNVNHTELLKHAAQIGISLVSSCVHFQLRAVPGSIENAPLSDLRK